MSFVGEVNIYGLCSERFVSVLAYHWVKTLSKNTSYQNLGNRMKAVLREKFIAIGTFIKVNLNYFRLINYVSCSLGEKTSNPQKLYRKK